MTSPYLSRPLRSLAEYTGELERRLRELDDDIAALKAGGPAPFALAHLERERAEAECRLALLRTGA